MWKKITYIQSTNHVYVIWDKEVCALGYEIFVSQAKRERSLHYKHYLYEIAVGTNKTGSINFVAHHICRYGA